MAKKQSFADKSSKKAHGMSCPTCEQKLQYIKHIKSTRGENGAWKIRPVTVGVCKCNEAEVYA